MRESFIAAMKTRRCLGLFLLGMVAFSFSFFFSLGFASGEKDPSGNSPVARDGNQVHQPVDVGGAILDSQPRLISRSRVLRTLPDPPSVHKAYASLVRDFGPFAKKCIAAAEGTDRMGPLRVLARVEPAWVLQYLHNNGFEEPWYSDYVRWAAAEVLLDQNIDDALAIVQSLESPMWRSMGCQKASSALPHSQRARKHSLLAEALLHARAIEAPDKQLSILSNVAGEFLDLGQTEQAARILEEGHKTAKTLPTKEWPGYARGSLAEQLARIDLKAALALVTEYEDDFDHDRHHGNIAHNLAEKDPAAAQTVLNSMRTIHNRDRWSSRVCYYMAPVDRDRAREIADAVETPCIRAHALGMIALSLSNSDKPLARQLIQEALAILASTGPTGRLPSPQDVGLALLPVVENINPELVHETLRQVLSLDEGPRILTAACVARYDRDIAAQWLPSERPDGRRRGQPYFSALALLDPEGAVRLANSLPESTQDEQNQKMRAWVEIIAMLRRNAQQRWEWILDSQMNLWHVGKEDL